MKDRLMKWLGAVPASELEKAQQKIVSLKAELLALQNEKKMERPIIAVDETEPVPSDTAKRKMYIAQVAGFHKDVLSPKLKHMIRTMREEFEKVNRDTFGYSQQEYDLYLKGAINGFWLLHDWGEAAINEMISYTQEPSETDLEELKDKLK